MRPGTISGDRPHWRKPILSSMLPRDTNKPSLLLIVLPKPGFAHTRLKP